MRQEVESVIAALGAGSVIQLSTSGQLPAQEWPSPIASDALIGLPGDFIGLVAKETEADANALLGQFLTAFGSAVGPGPWFRTERDRQGCNLFTVVVGETAGGRKGTGHGHVRDIISGADASWGEPTGLASGEGLIHHVRDPILTRDKKTGEMTVVDEGVSDKRLMIYEAEYANVLKVGAREGNTLSTTLRQAWETGNLQTMTRNNPMKATGAHISCIGHVTRDELTRLLTLTESASGFANRFTYMLSRRSRSLPDGGNVDETARQQLILRTAAMLARGKDWGELKRDDAARAVWHQEYERLTTPPAGLLGCMIARAAPIVMRMAVIYAVSDPDNSHAVIAADHLRAALAVWDYCDASCRFIFGDRLGDPTADTILSALRSSSEGLTRTDISQLFSKNVQAIEIDRALTMIAKRGLGGRLPSDPKAVGRPVERWKAAASGHA